MNRSTRPEILDLQSKPSTAATRARSKSTSSIDCPLSSDCSTSSLATNPLVNVSPAPAYIASSAATRLVTNDHEVFFHSLHEDGIVGPEAPIMCVTDDALKLVNGFLDFLLYTFVATAKSTSLAALRPAVTEVLRKRLAKEAVSGADQELRSYLGGEEGCEHVVDGDGVAVGSSEWDLESAWRKVRVQCMVYSSLGDLEEDDEAFYSEQVLEGSVGIEQYQQQSTIPGVVSPAVAIWLTSILEFIGEQTLLVAGHATIARYSVQRIAAAAASDTSLAGAKADVTFPENPMVEDHDTEKVALNPSMGRMWRQWRKKIRGSRGSISISARDGAAQSRLERQASLVGRVNSNTTELNLAALPAFIPIPPSAQLFPEEVEPKPCNLAPLEAQNDGPLTPIAETNTPRADAVQNKFLTVDAEGNEFTGSDSRPDEIDMRRPRSLILLPWTNVSPFTLVSASDNVKKHRSLPDLKRGDFADPDTEGLASNDHGREPFGNVQDFGNENHDASLTPSPSAESQFYTPAEEQTTPTLGSRENSDELRLAQALPDANYVPQPHPLKTEPIAEPRTDMPPIDITGHSPRALSISSGRGDLDAVDVSPETIPIQSNDDDMSPVSDVESPLIMPSISEHDNSLSTHIPRDYPRSKSFESSEGSEEQASAANHGLRPTVDEHFRSSHIKTPSSSSRHSQLSERKIGQVAVVQPSSSSQSERTGSVRVFTPPGTPERTRRSSSFSKLQRPTHTSGSTSSQTSTKLKNLIPWPNDAGKHTKLAESDTDSRSSLHSDRITTLDDKEKSFEELISGGGTIHCTITPDPIRNMEMKKSGRTQTSELADFFRSTGPDRRAGAPGYSKAATSVANITRTLTNTSTTRSIPGTPKNTKGNDYESGSLPHPRGSPVAVQMAPRKSDASSRSREIQSVDTPPGLPAHSHTAQPSIGAGIDVLPSVVRQSAPESSASATRLKSRLLAREANGSTGSDTTSALADFFRNTNPPANGEIAGNRRISRSVAPFRNTMDSAQFDPVEDEIERVSEDHKSSPSNFGVAPTPHESYQSSFNSSTALLRSSSRGKRDHGAAIPGLSSGPSSFGGPPEIKRKQVRNKDPYAIDLDLMVDDDDEDMDSLDLVLPKKRDEESLIDFLNSAPPPPHQPTLAFATPTNSKTVQKKQSAVSLMNRFGRSHRKNSVSTSDKAPRQPSPAPASKYVPLRIDAETMRQTSDSDLNKQPPQPSNFRSNVDSHHLPTRNGGRINRPTQARGGRVHVDASGTDSLADFLKNTGPPEMHAQPPPKEEGSRSVFKKMGFSRSSKKVGVV